MFTPTHFVDTDEHGAQNNRVENGQLVQEVRRTLTAFTSTPIVDVVTEDGEERSLFAERLAEFDPATHKVTCEYGGGENGWEHLLESDCRGSRVVKPEPAEEVDGVETLRVYLRSVRDALDKISDSIDAVERTLGEAQ